MTVGAAAVNEPLQIFWWKFMVVKSKEKYAEKDHSTLTLSCYIC